MFLPRLHIRINRKKALSFFSILAYVLVIFPAHSLLGDSAADLSVFPVVLLVWQYGLLAGVISSLLLTLLEFLINISFGNAIFSPGVLQMTASGLLTLIGISCATIWIRNLRDRAQIELKERQKAETALVERERKYSLLFENMVEGIAIDRMIYDGNGDVIDWLIQDVNAAYEKITRIPREAVVGKQASSVYGSLNDNFPLLLSIYQQVLKSQTPYSCEIQLASSGPVVMLTVTLLQADQLVVFLNDITEQKAAIEAERKQRLLAEALRDIAAALNSTLDLDRVLDLILVLIRKIASYDAVNIMLVSQNRVRVVRHHGYVERDLSSYIETFNRPISEVPGLHWMSENNQPMVIPETEKNDLWMVFPPTAWVQSYAGIPIRARGELIGFINFNSATPNHFQPDLVHRLQPFADQAALAILNAQVFEETKEHVHRLAVVTRVAHSLNQPIELKAVLQVTADCLAEALNLSQVRVAMFNDQHDRLIMVAECSTANHPSAQGSDINRVAELFTSQILSEVRAIYLDTARFDEHFKPAYDYMVECGLSALLIIPILARGEVLGIIECDVSDPGRYISAEEIELGETITNFAAVRIEQARLYAAERKRTQELTLLHVTSLDITLQNNSPALLNTIVERAAWLMNAPCGTLYLANPQKQELECRVSYNLSHDEIGTVLSYGEGAAGIVAMTSQSLVVPDYEKWPQRLYTGKQLGGFLAVVSVPVIWQHKVMGVLQIARSDPSQPFTNEEIDLLNLLSSQVAISLENSRLYTEIQQIAIQDTLTGLYNRRGLFEMGQREIERARRYKRPLSAIMMDIDLFKQVNDRYGHLMGDQVLAKSAEVCQQNFRNIDILGRYGGEEFVILLPENDIASAHIAAERIRKIIAETPMPGINGKFKITVSIGLAELKNHMTELKELIGAADEALYQAKRGGRNQVKCI